MQLDTRRSEMSMFRPSEENMRPSYRLRFLHIPKNAGTSVEETYWDLKWGYRDGKPTHKPINVKAFWHDHEVDRLDNCKYFCIMRDPMQRLLSEFGYNVGGGPYIDQLVRYETTLPSPQTNPKVLNEYLRDRMHKVKANPHADDNHLYPQKYFVEKCDFVVDFLRINNELGQLVTQFGICEKPLLKKNQTSNNKLTVDDIDRDNMEFWTDFYRDDIALYKLIRESSFDERPDGRDLVLQLIN